MTNKTGLNGRKKVLIVLDTLRRGGIEIAALRFCRLLKSDDYLADEDGVAFLNLMFQHGI